MYFNFDEPGFPIVLLAILSGLRLAVYVAERLAGSAPSPANLPLAPDEPVEIHHAPEVSVLPALEAATEESSTHAVLENHLSEERVGTNAHEEAALERPSRFMAELLDSGIIAVVLVFFIIRPFILQAFFIPSESMMPTLQNGDKLLATKYSYRLHEPHHHDVVVFQAPSLALSLLNQTDDPQHPTDYVKRVIGIPGDHIHIVANEGVYVNNELQREPYLYDPPDYNFPLATDGKLAIRYPITEELKAKYIQEIQPHIQGRDLVVPPGYIFVLGDNRTHSHDGHIWGLLPRQSLLGKATFIFWPLNRMGLVN